MKVGRDLDDDVRRTRILREELGPDRRLLIDANQVWDVDEAIDVGAGAAPTPTRGGSRSRRAPTTSSATPASRRPCARSGVATGEHCHNRVMFKQFFQADAIDIAQIDGCRLGGVNEVIAVLLLAAKFGVPVCPHAGGVGLCQHVQHFSMFDFVARLGSQRRPDDRVRRPPARALRRTAARRGGPLPRTDRRRASASR